MTHLASLTQGASNGHLNGHGQYGHNAEKEPLRQGELSTGEHPHGGFNVLEVQMPPACQQERSEFRWGSGASSSVKGSCSSFCM